jgi:thiosulfate/3-mercaptopyruvate sulfurtransferase
MYTTLITPQELMALQQSHAPLMVFDCSFELMNLNAGDTQFLQSHIVAAKRADLDRHLSAKSSPDAASGGRHPLPSREAFAAWLASLGFSANMQAVVYDRQGCNYCGRLWWMLKWLRHDAVAVLDGGFAAWQAAGGDVANGEATPNIESNYLAANTGYKLAVTENVAKQLGRASQTVIDARATPRFLGEVEPLDPVAGHIPGALNRPFGLNFTPQGKFKPAATLRAEFLALLGPNDPATVVHQCGSGVSAVPNLLAMEIAGLGTTALYAGSWSEWCSDPARPVARG